MIAEFFAFAGLLVLSWPFLLFLFLAGVVFEHNNSHKWAVFTGLVTLVIGYLYFDVGLLTIVEWAVGYVVIGFCWSFWRYHRYMGKKVEELKSGSYAASSLARHLEELHPSQNLNLITTWIIIWPFSAVENVLGDVIDVIRTLVTKVFRSIYAKIYASHVSDLPKSPE